MEENTPLKGYTDIALYLPFFISNETKIVAINAEQSLL